MSATILQELDGLENPRALLHAAITMLEKAMCMGPYRPEGDGWLPTSYLPDESWPRVRQELLDLLDSPLRQAYDSQAAVFWNLIEKRRDRIIFFCRTRSPLANVVYGLTHGGARFRRDFVEGKWRESDFNFVTRAAGDMARASIRFCDVREPDAFMLRLFDTYEHFDCAVCDWIPEAREMAGMTKLTQRSGLLFVLPGAAPEPACGNPAMA